MSLLAASALVVGGSVSVAGAAAAKAPLCAGKTKKQAIKDIKLAYAHFLDGAKFPDAIADKEPFIQFMSGKQVSPALKAAFEASSAANATAAAGTSVKVNSAKCTGKKTADVDFVLVINGEEVPLPQTEAGGKAVLDAGTWKVTAETLCNLQSAGDPSILESGPCYEIATGGEPSDLTAG
jgi:hypothetical protein